jgi:hypothetical protein
MQILVIASFIPCTLSLNFNPNPKIKDGRGCWPRSWSRLDNMHLLGYRYWKILWREWNKFYLTSPFFQIKFRSTSEAVFGRKSTNEIKNQPQRWGSRNLLEMQSRRLPQTLASAPSSRRPFSRKAIQNPGSRWDWPQSQRSYTTWTRSHYTAEDCSQCLCRKRTKDAEGGNSSSYHNFRKRIIPKICDLKDFYITIRLSGNFYVYMK